MQLIVLLIGTPGCIKEIVQNFGSILILALQRLHDLIGKTLQVRIICLINSDAHSETMHRRSPITTTAHRHSQSSCTDSGSCSQYNLLLFHAICSYSKIKASWAESNSVSGVRISKSGSCSGTSVPWIRPLRCSMV